MVVGEEPNLAEYTEGWEVHKRPKGYEATKTAICGGLKNFIRYEGACAELEAEPKRLRVDHANAPDMVQESHPLCQDFCLAFNGITGPNLLTFRPCVLDSKGWQLL